MESKYLYLDKNRADAWQVSTGLQLPTEAYQADGSSIDILSHSENDVNISSNIDAMASGGAVGTYSQKQMRSAKKLEGSALKAVQNLAKDMKVGLRIKSGQRFQSADARMSRGVLGYYKNDQRNAIFHSDRGFQYTNRTFHCKLKKAGMTQSMSCVAKCIDNGPMEGFWGILKRERYYGKRFTSKKALIQMITDYISYYNNRRVQRKLEILTPFEKHVLFLSA